jgi:hypothetical protein
LKAFQHKAVLYSAAALLGLGVTAGCDSQPASVGQEPFYQLTSNSMYTAHPPWSSGTGADGGVNVVATIQRPSSDPAYLVAWASSDKYACYGLVDTQTPTGDLKCTSAGSSLTTASAPALFRPIVPVVTPDGAEVVEFGFAHGPVSKVDVTMSGKDFKANVTSLLSSAQLGAYAFVVSDPKDADARSVTKMNGLTPNGGNITALSSW